MADIRINSLPSTATSFNTDDYIAIDGASGGTRKMLAATLPLTDVTLGGTSGPSVKSSLSARAPRQGLVFDGTAGNFGSATIPAPGTAKSIHLIVGVPSSNPSANQALLVIGNDSSFVSTQWISLRTTGELWFETTNSGGSDAARIVVSGFVSANAGKTVSVVFTLDGSSTATAYVNGVVAATNSDADWATSVSGTQLKLGGSSQFAEFSGAILSPLIYNRALSASEVVALYEAGAPAGADYGQGTNDSGATVYSGQQMVNGDNSTFASDTGWWTKASGVSITGGKLVLSSVATGSAAILRNSVLKIGIRYRVTFTISNYSAGGVKIQFGGTSGTTRTANGTYTEEVVCGSSNTNLYPLVTVGTTTLDVDDLTVTPSGLLLAPDAAQAGGGLVWYDTSGNAANISWTSGVSWNVPSSSYWGGQLKLQSTTGTNGLRINNISSDTFGFFGGGNDGLPVFSSLNNATIGSATYGWLAFNSSVTGDFELYRRNNSTTNTAALIVARSTGNVLIGTTTDLGQKLQVGGDSGFLGHLEIPANKHIYMKQSNPLRWSSDGLSTGSVRADVYADSGGALYLRTNGSNTALTLDSSQNATFAGNLTVSGVQNVIGSASPSANFPLRINQGATDATVTMDIANVSSGTSAAANIQLQTDAGTSFLRQHSAAHSVWPNYLLLGGSDKIAISTGSTSDGIELMTGFTTRVNITTATTTVSNNLAINNTVQTAVAVASTHKVTISIGGTTYYLLATNV